MDEHVDLIGEAQRNWDARGWAESDAMAAATSITRAHQIVLARINEALVPHGLTFSRYEALVLISFTRRGSLPMGKIGERLQVHPTSVTNAIDRLETAGLVRRKPHPTDRRTTLAEITEAGREAVLAATRDLETIRYGMDDLGDATTRAVVASLAGLRRSAGDF
ncbi:MAG: MarR family transcriptional regulator [Acidimicrobiia bacterium]|nr:MarR family transcriptional regulator [Acidimicrobiia bacterium]